MNGILFGDFFVKLLEIIFTGYSVLFVVGRVLLEEKNDREDEEKKQTEKLVLKDIITFLVIIIVVIAMMWGIVYWIIDRKNIVAAGVILLLSFLYCGIAFGVAILEFVRYVFLKSSNFKMTKGIESSMWLIGLSTCFVCHCLEIEGLGKIIEQSLANLTNYESDILKAILLIFWYFSIVFFGVVFSILSVHKLIVIFKKYIKLPNCKKHEFKWKSKDWQKISEKIWNKIEVIPQKNIWKKIIYYLIWLLVLIVDVAVVFMIAFIRMLIDLIRVMLIIIPRKMWGYIKTLLGKLENDQGKAIIISSRIALVSSLLIVFCIDKYKHLFSADGSAVYEFICSVILIPFLITQLGALKEKNKERACEKS